MDELLHHFLANFDKLVQKRVISGNHLEFSEIPTKISEIFTDSFRNFGKLQTIAGNHYLLHQFLEIREKMVQKFINC